MSGETTSSFEKRQAIRLPSDQQTRDALNAKKAEYAQRIADAAGEYTHPEVAAVAGLLKGDTFCFDMLVRIELIGALEEFPDGVDPEAFTEDFLDRHSMLVGSGDNAQFKGILRAQVLHESKVIEAYCTGNLALLSGGTGLHNPAAND